jgi:hypothetical protein
MLEQLIATIEAQDQKREIVAEQFVREQRILDELAPRMWQSLRSALKSESEKYPDHFIFEVRPNTEAVIRGKGRSVKVFDVRFLPKSKRVCLRCGDFEAEYSIRLDESTKAVLCDPDGQAYSSVSFVAGQLLALLLN